MAFVRSILPENVFPDFGDRPGGLEFEDTKILAQFTNYIFLYLTMMYPQYAKEITRKSIQPFL